MTDLEEALDLFLTTYQGLAVDAGRTEEGLIRMPPLVAYKAEQDNAGDDRPFLLPILVEGEVVVQAWDLLHENLEKLYSAYGPATWVGWVNVAFMVIRESEDHKVSPGDLLQRYLDGDPAVGQTVIVTGFAKDEMVIKAFPITFDDEDKPVWGEQIDQENIIEVGGVEAVMREYLA